MPQPTYPRFIEPLVAQNPFRQISCERKSIAKFNQVKEHLPEPALPDHPEWVEMYWRAWEVAWSNLRQPKADTGFVANFIAPTFCDHVFMWDSAFTVLFGLYGRRHFNFLGMLDNFYVKQHDDGFICRQINLSDGKDVFPPFDPNGTGPNILAWAEWRYFRATGDSSRLAQVFWPLMALHRWFRDNRTWPSGLYWATGLSSGMDNQPRVPDSMYRHRHWSWVDANMQAALNCHVLEQMATSLEEMALAAELAAERVQLIQLINEQLWNEEAQFYQDLAPDGRFSKVKSIGAYWALLDKELTPEKRLTPFVQHLRDSWAFNVPHRIPSQSADSEGYNAKTGNSWRGAVWSSTNYMTLRGLRAVGQYVLAHEIAVNHVGNVCEAYLHTDTFWENYAPEAAAPGEPARSDSVGGTGLTPIAILLEDVIGISVDWPLRRVVWDRRLATDGRYGVRRYPLGNEGTATLMGDRETVTVTTDVPFTLTIRDAEQSLQTAVPAGETEISLM
ncbi:MAG: glycoside hydrolase [Chloroflexi bacterium]|nr:glycoside hydrolase [Chloroflexota bacterium]